MANQILNGQNPAELPVELSENHLVINLATAKAIELKVPTHILKQATKIIRD